MCYQEIKERRSGRRKKASSRGEYSKVSLNQKFSLNQLNTKRAYNNILKQATLWSGIYDDSIVGFIGIRNMLCNIAYVYLSG